MAFVHPSRMALVPKDSRSLPSSGTRLPSPPASPPRDRSVDRYQRRSRDEKHNGDRERRGRSDRSRDHTDRDDERRRDRGRSSNRDQDRHRSRHRSNGDRYDDRRNENRDSDSKGPRSQRDDHSPVRSPPPSSSRPPLGRASPTYDDYSRRHAAPSPLPPDDKSGRSGAPPENAPPWHQQENMYRRDGRLDGGGDYFERRRQQRVNNTFSIWPPSPRAPARDLSPERDREARKRHKRDRSTSVSSSLADSEEERRRRERKERKRARKERDRRKRRNRRSQSASDDEARERHRDSRKRRSQSRSRERRKSRSRTPSPRRAQSSDEDEWVEKPAPSGSFVPTSMSTLNISPPSIIRNAQRSALDNDASDDEVGPQPVLAPSTTKKLDERAYGSALLRGEGSAMAAFLQDGTDVRIPRRGEIGLTSGEIDRFESVGYVMSGSRHRRMNAVRMRKENQVISAEEKRGILKLQQEEKQRREAILREEFQELLSDRLKGTEGAKTS
ncbi:DUF926-domain-containing protein [Russula emetica]|nr:DUF926-domain-containing protein [Russula emetica]